MENHGVVKLILVDPSLPAIQMGCGTHSCRKEAISEKENHRIIIFLVGRDY